MKRFFKLTVFSVALVFAASVSAFAGSITDSFSGAALTGVSGTASGSFTFNSSNDTFSNLSVSFNGGVFSGVNASDPNGGQGTCIGNLCGFYWQTGAKGDSVWDTIVLNIQTGQYEDFGGIYNWQNQGDFNYLSVPEGGAKLAYLMLSALAMFGGIFLSGKQRRSMRTH